MYYQTQELPEAIDFTALHHHFPERYPVALVSTAENNQQGRYDILFAFPQMTLKLDNEKVLSSNGDVIDGEFLTALDDCWQNERVDAADDPGDLPFTGGWFIFLAYELASEIEPSLHLEPADPTLPVALAMRCPAAIIYDHKTDVSFILVENDSCDYFETIKDDINKAQSLPLKPQAIVATSIVESEVDPYLYQLDRIKTYIKEGDIFQANLSRLWELTIEDVPNVDIFKRLSQNNPGSFAALFQLGDVAIISSSPERLVSVKGNNIQTRPIAGTRPRTDKIEADKSLSEELLAHPKEKAEHIMLIDLERNDLGRLCVPGSIKVDELMTLESYQHVHHIVSNVQGQIRKEVTPGEVIRAVFPGGTITGCPKVRCMQILTEMEQQARGAYTGSLGYINRDGSMDLNILIRTMVRINNQITFRAGGGIVADSDPDRELEETRAKAKGLLKVFS